MQSYTFHVAGMHCKSCEVLTEQELVSHPRIKHVKADLAGLNVNVTGDFGDRLPEAVAAELSGLMERHGYKILAEAPAKASRNLADFKLAVPIALAFLALFVILQRLGIVNLVSVSQVNFGAAFAIGIIASLSTCMAVVGGLVLSMSATFAKEGDRLRPQILFHLGRLVSFFVLGGVIGAIGSAFALGKVGTVLLSVLVGLVMLVMGVNLLGVFHFAKRLTPSMPKFVAKHIAGLTKLNHSLTPLLVGVATFFLPCGFTQSMQIYSLTLGSFLAAALTMFAFALGTLPILAALSFSSFAIAKSRYAGVFWKSAGLVVVAFALLNLANSLVVLGIIPAFLNF
jgi:uncharacterized protein